MKITRRKLLEAVAVSAASVAFGSSIIGCSSSSSGSSSSTNLSTFPQSVMSGDPRADSVILWTRVVAAQSVDVSLVLEVSLDDKFTTLVVDETLTALSSHDNCLKVRVNGLNADTIYYYRFISGSIATNTGRTKTAPDAASDRKVKFAFVSCQDYIGRYYNTYIRMLQDDLDDIDFVVHLGDYIYETSGDPTFQSSSSTRKVTFTGTGDDAPLTVGSGESAFEAAQTVHNYRELYKTYRSDELLQKVHEKFPMVVIWDDHEFSDDSWQNNATYHGVSTGEGNINRKQDAEQVFFEYIPIDQTNVAGQSAILTQGRIDVDNASLSQGVVTSGVGSISDGVEIYRSLRFGQHLDLFLTDYRTHRPDHLIAEDAFPGGLVMTSADLNGFVVAAPAVTAFQALTGSGAFDANGADSFTYFNFASVDPVEAGYASVLTGGGDPAQNVMLGALITSYLAAYDAKGFAATDLVDGVVVSTLAQTKAAQALSGNMLLAVLESVLSGVYASEGGPTIIATIDATLQGALGASHALQIDAVKEEVKLSTDLSSTLPKGLGYATMGKTSFFSELGSRYLVVKATYDLYSGWAYQNFVGSAGASGKDQNAHGAEQALWLNTGLAASDATWRVLGSSVSLTSMILGLNSTGIAAATPAIAGTQLDNDFYLNVDQWDGFGTYRAAGVIPALEKTGNSPNGAISIAGDIHSSWVSKHGSSSDIVSFTCPSISSGTFQQFIRDQAATLVTDTAALDSLLSLADHIVHTSSEFQSASDKASGGEIAYNKLETHGFAVAEVGGDDFTVTLHQLPPTYTGIDMVGVSHYNSESLVLDAFEEVTFKVENGSLERLV